MNEDEAHDLRMELGQHSMALGDVMVSDEGVAAVLKLRDATLEFAAVLDEVGLPWHLMAGMIAGNVMHFIADKYGDT